MKSSKILLALVFIFACLSGAYPAHGQAETPGEEAPRSVDALINESMDAPTKLITSVIFYAIKFRKIDYAGYNLGLMSAAAPSDLPREGESLVVVALVGADLHIRIFDSEGTRVVDKPESALAPGQGLQDLKDLLDEDPFPQEDDLSQEKTQEFIKTATAIADYTHAISVPLVLVWLAFAAIFFTFYFKFINLRSFGLALRTIKGRYTRKDDPGEITHFQALSAALSGTVGLGNIAGVAIAVQLGGPGATFWMIVMGLFGMTSKFVECTLGVRFREIDAKGRVFGGPMRYLSTGFKERGLGQLGMLLAMFFAVMCVGGSIGGGNLFQINSATQQFIDAFTVNGDASFLGQNRWIFGLVVATIVAAVIIGGIRSIGRTTAILVPFMCGVYILAVIVVIILHLDQLPTAIGSIITKAFDPDAVSGGIIGCMLLGIQRAAFSNEAGIGSAAIAHSAVRTTKPASEGLVALLEPFVDTVVVCTMTALAIVVTGVYQTNDAVGVALTSAAFETVMPWFKMVLSVAVILFALSTMISWSYYGMQAWAFLFGKSTFMDLAYKVMFCGFIVIGSSMSLGNVVNFSDSMIFAMAIPNIIGLYFLLPVVRRELDDYRSHCEKIDSNS